MNAAGVLTVLFLGVCFFLCVCMQDLTAALVARAHAGPSEVVEELKAQLGLKEKLFQELLSDHSRQTNEHQAQVQDLLSTLSSKDQYLQVGGGAGIHKQLVDLSRTIKDYHSFSVRTTPTGFP